MNSFFQDLEIALSSLTTHSPALVSFGLNGILTTFKTLDLLQNEYDSELFNDSWTSSHSMQFYIISGIMFFISCLNVWSMRHRTKAYTLLYQPTTGSHDSIKSPNASIILTDIQNNMDLKVGKASWISNQNWEKSVVMEERWQINIWDPTDLQLALVSSFSPLHICLVFNITNDNFWTSLLLLISNYYLMNLMNNQWSGKVRDQKILSSQVLKEFTDNFVYKLPTFKGKRDNSSQCI